MLNIRQFTEADRERLREIYLASRRFGFSFLDVDAFQLEDFESDTDGEVILVAELEDEIVGFASYWAPENFIHNLYLAPEHTGKGHGKALFLRAVAHAGVPVRLKCVIENSRALGFYLALGMNIVDEGETNAGRHYVLEYSGNV